MIFRNIRITRIVFQILRSNYAIAKYVVNETATYSLNVLYRYLVCCLYGLKFLFETYNENRRREFMIASCLPVNGQTELVLNALFGQYGAIDVGEVEYQTIYFYDAASSTTENQVYLYTSDQNKPLYLGFAGASSNLFIITIPLALQEDIVLYNEFLATLNALIPYSLRYEIKTK